MYLVMEYVKYGPIGGSRFWKFRNKKLGADPENTKFTVEEIRTFFGQLILGIDSSNPKISKIFF